MSDGEYRAVHLDEVDAARERRPRCGECSRDIPQDTAHFCADCWNALQGALCDLADAARAVAGTYNIDGRVFCAHCHYYADGEGCLCSYHYLRAALARLDGDSGGAA